MTGKIILNLAISLDGYIADIDDKYDWIKGSNDHSLDSENKWDYQLFLKDIDVVLMGKNCFDLNMHEEFKDKKVFVATHSIYEDKKNIHFIQGNLVEEMNEFKMQGKNVYLFGGGKVIDSFIKEDAIDEYIIGIIPTILGEGIPLFYPHEKTVSLKLVGEFIEDGIVILKYSKS